MIRKNELTGLGALLRRTVDDLCAKHDLTHGELATRVGIHHSNLCRSFRSETGGAVLLAVCEAFDLYLEVVPNEK